METVIEKAGAPAGPRSSEGDLFGLYARPDLSPEKRLLFAVLLDAVECFQQNAVSEPNHLFKETEQWIFADDPEWLFSFTCICEAVELNPQYLRKGLRNWKERASHETSSRSACRDRDRRKRCG